MATKQVKKTASTRTYQSSSSSSGAADGSSSSSFRGRSPSPARISRLAEKDQLTSLNDRLAAYIDHIRSLETENQKLHIQVQSFEETSKREVSNVKELYERELLAARKLIDDLSKENAQLTVSVGTYKSEAEEWMRKHTVKDRDLTALQKKYSDVESRLADLESKLAAALRDADHWKQQHQSVRSDVADLERQLASARKQLEEETLAKVDLENRVQSLKEELAFKAQLHESELNETRSRMEYTMDEVDSKTQKEVESRLQEALAEFRAQHELQTQIYREELETLYESKISGLEKELASQDGMDESVRIEISSYKSKISELQGQINKLANQNAALEARVASLEVDLATERDQSKALAESKEKEIKFLRQQMSDQMREYQDLLDIKVSLDLEIAAYRKLLEGEEERLNMSQSFSQSSVKSTPRKRRRGEGSEVHSDFVQETDSRAAYASSGMVLGSMEITEVSEEGKYVKIKNLADEEATLAGWRISHKGGDSEEAEYKFHRSVKLGGGEIATVWSSDAGATHDASSHNFVMKNQKWFTGDTMATTLTDKEGKEQATLELKKSSQRTVLRAARPSDRMVEGEDGKSCSLM